MGIIRKHKFLLIFGFAITLLYIFTRLFNIMSLPIFTDEAIYVRWAQIAKQDANWRFISLTDGKQPSFVWATMIFLRFVEDPLLAGRLVSVAAGLFSMVGLFFLGRELFRSIWGGILSSAVYVLFPMALVYDRMALYEGVVGAFVVWGLYLTVFLARNIRLDIALILGMVIGGGVLTKTSAFFSIYLLPLSLLLFDFKRKKMYSKFLKWAGLAFVSIIIAYGMYSILRLSPFFHIINEKNGLFVYPLKEWIKHPFEFWYGNILGEWDWLRRYMTVSGIILTLSSFVIDRRFFREKIFLILWFLIPFVALGVFGRTLYPRFIFFMTLSLLPLVAFSARATYKLVKNKLVLFVLLIVFLVPPLISDYFILSNFSKAPIPRIDLDQYINGWTSGCGVKEVVEFLKNEAKDKKIFVATEGTFGLMPYALEIYLIDNKNITIVGFWPIGDTIPQKVIDESKKNPTYFLFYQPCVPCAGIVFPPSTWKSLELAYQYKKDYSGRSLSLYRVKP